MVDCRKSVNNFYFYFYFYFGKSPIRNYFILLVLYFWEESYWDCASGVPFHLYVDSPSTLSHVLITSRVPLGLC